MMYILGQSRKQDHWHESGSIFLSYSPNYYFLVGALVLSKEKEDFILYFELGRNFWILVSVRLLLCLIYVAGMGLYCYKILKYIELYPAFLVILLVTGNIGGMDGGGWGVGIETKGKMRQIEVTENNLSYWSPNNYFLPKHTRLLPARCLDISQVIP